VWWGIGAGGFPLLFRLPPSQELRQLQAGHKDAAGSR